jgi:hypothetical protein
VHMHEEPALDIAGDEAQAHGDLDGDP